MLWSSAAFFATVIGLMMLTTRLPVREHLLPGLAAPVALAASSLASTWHPGPEITLLGFVLRFVPAALVFGYFNREGRARIAGLATLWTWIWLEVVFVLRFDAQPALSEFLSSPVVFYLILPAVAGFLMKLPTPLARFLSGAHILYRGRSWRQ